MTEGLVKRGAQSLQATLLRKQLDFLCRWRRWEPRVHSRVSFQILLPPHRPALASLGTPAESPAVPAPIPAPLPGATPSQRRRERSLKGEGEEADGAAAPGAGRGGGHGNAPLGCSSSTTLPSTAPRSLPVRPPRVLCQAVMEGFPLLLPSARALLWAVGRGRAAAALGAVSQSATGNRASAGTSLRVRGGIS